MGLLFILVGIGGGLGAMARFGLTQATADISKQIPLGIFLCNVIGSFFIGLIAAFLIKTNLFNEEISVNVRALLVTGFLGGFTTFSSFSLDVLNLLQREKFDSIKLYFGKCANFIISCDSWVLYGVRSI